jgi:putative phosphoribosyl transferase
VQVETTFTGFADRTEAGHKLAEALRHYRGKASTIVLGLPRGGVLTAAAIADELALPLDVLVVRKLGVPGNEELAMGAIGPRGIRVLNEDVIGAYRLDPFRVRVAEERERGELERRERLYRGQQRPLDVAGKTVIVADDGLATGSTMAAAIAVLRAERPARVVLAVPVAPVDTCERFRLIVDELVYLETPDPFLSVGYWYVDFAQVSDDEVIRALSDARARAMTNS